MSLSRQRRRSERQFNDLSGTEWIRFTRSWFVCNPPRRSADQIQHPAKFPERMADEFIRFFTRAGELVLDPFAGVGSTLLAAHQAGRRAIGTEIAPHFHALALENLARHGCDGAEVVLADARDCASLLRQRGLDKVQMILTSPPYWDMLRQSRGGVESVHKKRKKLGLSTVYSDDTRDLGNIGSYHEFLDALAALFMQLAGVLAPARYMVIVCQNVRVPEGVVKPLAWDLAARLSAHLQFKGERIWVQDNKPLGIWGYPSEFVTNVHHHYCLIFKNASPR